jgi:phosphatidylserine decarboxylase
MAARRHSIIAGEGLPVLIGAGVVAFLLYRFAGPEWGVPAAVFTLWLFFLFRDPNRNVPPLPTAVLAPVDGKVLTVTRCADELLPGEWWRISIRPSHLGAYTVRAPIEGTILEVRDKILPGSRPTRGLWLRSEENDDVVVLFPRRRRYFGPKTFASYGERVGQGQRFAYLRMATLAEIYVPATSQVRVSDGARIRAGLDVLADLALKSA